MSTGSECEFIEVEPDEWYYILEHMHAPKNAGDWRDYATGYGPFRSRQTANIHLCDHHANPGGHSVQPYVDGFKPDATLAELIRDAHR